MNNTWKWFTQIQEEEQVESDELQAAISQNREATITAMGQARKNKQHASGVLKIAEDALTLLDKTQMKFGKIKDG